MIVFLVSDFCPGFNASLHQFAKKFMWLILVRWILRLAIYDVIQLSDIFWIENLLIFLSVLVWDWVQVSYLKFIISFIMRVIIRLGTISCAIMSFVILLIGTFFSFSQEISFRSWARMSFSNEINIFVDFIFKISFSEGINFVPAGQDSRNKHAYNCFNHFIFFI